ncbi:hypothetical protein BD311DRAFT_771071 [Dichomitus squalens]|uniref:Uncharacterized protein n=1 Tax=Dichomitus squalens TaxID=114155 RepID=A0A4Q9M551_9APHY|nr:hypothetical protein BD311DRAFT_771071 [Dichomitus squalens]
MGEAQLVRIDYSAAENEDGEIRIAGYYTQYARLRGGGNSTRMRIIENGERGAGPGQSHRAAVSFATISVLHRQTCGRETCEGAMCYSDGVDLMPRVRVCTHWTVRYS